jgi:hypothetical protein
MRRKFEAGIDPDQLMNIGFLPSRIKASMWQLMPATCTGAVEANAARTVTPVWLRPIADISGKP